MELKTYKRGQVLKWEGTGKWKLEQKKKGSGNWVRREGNWNRKVGTARWGGGGKRSWKRGGC